MCIYIYINVGLGLLAWDMIWAHVGPVPGGAPPAPVVIRPPPAPAGPGPWPMGPHEPRGPYHIPGKVS